MKIIRIIGQLIILSIVSFLGGILIYMKIPGNGELCDAGQIFLVYLWGLFLLASFLLTANSIILYRKNHWKKHRLFSLFLVSILLTSSLMLRPVIKYFSFGQETMRIVNNDDDWLFIDITLYKNGTFFSQIYDLSCEEEIVGKYTITNQILNLKYNKESK